MAERTGRRGRQSLMDEMGITDQEIARRKEYLQFGGEEIRRLTSVNDLAMKWANEVVEEFYRHLLSFEECRAFFTDPEVLERVKRRQNEYFVELTQGKYGHDYVEERLKIGAIHERSNLPVKWYLCMYDFYLRAVAPRVFEAFPDDPHQALEIFLSFTKIIFLDISLAIDTYVQRRDQTMRQQQEALRELSTPVLPLREGLLMLPIIGLIDSMRALQLTEQLLRAIRANRARVVVMDITGVPVVDSKVANHLVQTVQASRLMGASVIVTGLSPEIAQTLVGLGLDLSMMHLLGDLQTGITEADRLLGYRVSMMEAGTPPVDQP